MPRLAELGIEVGLLPAGATDSVHDVPGVGVGHATVWRDEPTPPAGRGVARTGVSVLDFGGSAFRRPVPAGSAVLGGAGECTGRLQIDEWGLVETPVFLTSTMQVGRVYDAAVGLLAAEDGAIGATDVVIPVVAECDDSYLSEARVVQLSATDVADALTAARRAAGGPAPPRGAVGAGTGMVCFDLKGGIGTASRRLPGGGLVAALVLTNFGTLERLTIGGRRVGTGLAREGVPRRPRPAGSCIVVLVTDGALDPAGCARLARRASLGLGRVGSTAHHSSGEILLAFATGLRADREAPPPGRPVAGGDLDAYFDAAVEATEAAVLDSLLAAIDVTGRDGVRVPALPTDRLAELLGEGRAD